LRLVAEQDGGAILIDFAIRPLNDLRLNRSAGGLVTNPAVVLCLAELLLDRPLLGPCKKNIGGKTSGNDRADLRRLRCDAV
jgi:hypothetical protein